MKYTIIADSSCDLKVADIKSHALTFATVPLTITMNDVDYIDDESLDTKEFVRVMKINKDAPLTSCPSPEAFAEEMRRGGEYIICITITSKLSGTYNSARVAAETVMQEDPGKKIYVLDSLRTSSGMIIVIDKLIKLIESEQYTFEEITRKAFEINRVTKVRFLLQNFGNLVKTGRMKKAVSHIVTAINLKLLCGDEDGEIKKFDQKLGTRKALQRLSEFPRDKIAEEGIETPMVITHCQNEEDAASLKALLEARFGLKNIKTFLMRGLTSFYSNDKGLILGY